MDKEQDKSSNASPRALTCSKPPVFKELTLWAFFWKSGEENLSNVRRGPEPMIGITNIWFYLQNIVWRIIFFQVSDLISLKVVFLFRDSISNLNNLTYNYF